MKISSKKLLLVFAAIMLAIVFWKFFSLLSFTDSSVVLQKGLKIKINPGETLTQKFTANRNGLAKVEILMHQSGIKYENGDKVQAKISDKDCQNVLREGELKESFLDTENLYLFSFAPISDSEDKEFCFIATFLPVNPTAKSLQFFTTGEEENQPYSIRTVYKNQNILQDLSELNQRISQYKPWFLKHYYLYTVSILFIILSISLVVILILM